MSSYYNCNRRAILSPERGGGMSECTQLELPTGLTQFPHIRLGTDLVLVEDVAHSISTFGDRYIRRVFTAHESEVCRDASGEPDPSRLAARFAAKEASIKALGLMVGVSLTDIEIVSLPTGQPTLSLSGVPREAFKQARGFDAQVSLSHEGPYATATVVVLTYPPTPLALR
ncbi:MAG: holo-ACP synthase [Ilumatobacteraceae bacterium]